MFFSINFDYFTDIHLITVDSFETYNFQVEFKDEEGTGLGPTLEFFTLVAAELQRKDLRLWLCNDDIKDIPFFSVRYYIFFHILYFS